MPVLSAVITQLFLIIFKEPGFHFYRLSVSIAINDLYVYVNIMKNLKSDIWLPSFWFFLYSTAHGYPEYPNAVTKRKFYDFIQNLPLFCPNTEVQKILLQVLDSFPVTPYLDNRDSFTYWVHFVNNKIDYELGNDEHTYYQHLDMYYNAYLPKKYKLSEKMGLQKKHIILVILAIFGLFILYHTK